MLPNISAVVLFVEKLAQCKAFYEDKVGLKVTFSDDVSHAFRLGSVDFLLLEVGAAVDMISADAISPGAAAGHRVLLCSGVEDVDALYQALTARGLTFIKPPIDQAWGRRTAYFADPEGNLWELWQHLPESS